LYLAAGGGGDALGALMIHGVVGDTAEVPLFIATYAWERLRIDPSPGPRGISGFQGLDAVGGEPLEISSSSDTVPPGRSTLPRLAAASRARLFLLDPGNGAVGMRQQLAHMVDHLDIDRVDVVDIGGDVIADGSEVGLLSPLADALALAACRDLAVQVRVIVAGPALDGELDEATTRRNLQAVGAAQIGEVGPREYAAVRDILAWHPTEATAVLAAAGIGVGGVVEIRRPFIRVDVTDESTMVWAAQLKDVVDHSLIVQDLGHTETLVDVEDVVGRTAVSELDRERHKALNLPKETGGSEDTACKIRDYARDAADREVDFITHRRLVEAACAPSLSPDDVRQLMGLRAGEAMRGPLWDLSAILRSGG
jgi:hypothetical protein